MSPIPRTHQVEIPASINWVFWILIVVSISVFTYSLTSKLFPKLNLPDFPFYPYIIGYALLILLIQFKKFIPLFTIIALLNFGSPTFRGIFFSHFSSTIWTVVFTVMFIASNISSLLVLSSGLFLRFVPKKQQIDQMDIAKGTLLSLPLTFALYFGLISPFYLGVIKPGPYGGNIEPEPYKIDHVYKEVLTTTTADREIGRKYLLDGKQSADKGTRAGFIESIEFYKKALELIPNFSTAYAEMAYSHASIGKILKSIKPEDKTIGEYFNEAKKTINKAKEFNPNNPTVYGVEAILEYYSGNEKSARNSLVKAENLAKEGGYSEWVVQAMAMMEKEKKKVVEYLLGIKKIIPNSTELHNLLGVSYYRIGNKENAKQMFDRVILLNPDYGEAYLNLALVADDKIGIYKIVPQKDADFKEVAEYYSRLQNWQKYLRIAYLALMIWFILKSFYLSAKGTDPATKTIQPQSLKRIKVMFLRYVGLFVITYGIFEWYIHIYRPINTMSHLFPVKFPFF